MHEVRPKIKALPKVLLHDHLDGGVRPQTVLELAREVGYDGLPVDDVQGLADWFRDSADSGSLVRYLETFAQTVAVMQTRDALFRVASECAQDLADDAVVYAEVRYAPEQHLEQGLTLEQVIEAVNAGFRDGEARAADGRDESDHIGSEPVETLCRSQPDTTNSKGKCAYKIKNLNECRHIFVILYAK